MCGRVPPWWSAHAAAVSRMRLSLQHVSARPPMAPVECARRLLSPRVTYSEEGLGERCTGELVRAQPPKEGAVDAVDDKSAMAMVARQWLR